MTTPPLPPARRSDQALQLGRAALEGCFRLQRCQECGATLYPAAEACSACLGTELEWRDLPATGELMAVTTIHRSIEPYFQAGPHAIGLIRVEDEVTLVAHLAPGCPLAGTVNLSQRLDVAGAGVIVASAPGGEDIVPGFSAILGGVCELITPAPEIAAAEVVEALGKMGLNEIQVCHGEKVVVTARDGDRQIRAVFKSTKEA